MTMEEMPKIDAYSTFYYLLVDYNGGAGANETALCRTMCQTENFDVVQFESLIQRYNLTTKKSLRKRCIKLLRNCSYQIRVNCLSWMVNIAYANCIMNEGEWGLIYTIGRKLRVNHADILEVRKMLPSLIPIR
jgi:uncharacterized tellurite resistance protein B-like protein